MTGCYFSPPWTGTETGRMGKGGVVGLILPHLKLNSRQGSSLESQLEKSWWNSQGLDIQRVIISIRASPSPTWRKKNAAGYFGAFARANFGKPRTQGDILVSSLSTISRDTKATVSLCLSWLIILKGKWVHSLYHNQKLFFIFCIFYFSNNTITNFGIGSVN